MNKIKLGISQCLLGESVRYDGGHKLDRFLRDTLGRYVEYVPVCPEVECGLPVPREAMRLVGDPESPRLLTRRSKVDHTERMLQWARGRVKELVKEDLCGFIFKSRSPSSGLHRIKVYDEKTGMPKNTGVGLFARLFTERLPHIPAEDEGRLHDPGIRENFIERIFTFMRWRELLGKRKSRGGLVEFHTRHKLLVLSHSPKHYTAMGKLVAGTGAPAPGRLHDKYERLLAEALALKATARKNTNVLMHMLGYFKKQLTADEKHEMLEVIENYRLEGIPLIVPITLLNHYVRKYEQPYLAQQHYLNPHPLELQLRNHV